MRDSPVHKLDYAAPLAHRRERPYVRWLGGTLVIAILLFLTDVKFTPGGPFVSLHAEVVPFVLCLGIAVCGGPLLLRGSGLRRLVVALFIIIAMAIMYAVIDTITSYASGRSSRGVLIGL